MTLAIMRTDFGEARSGIQVRQRWLGSGAVVDSLRAGLQGAGHIMPGQGCRLSGSFRAASPTGVSPWSLGLINTKVSTAAAVSEHEHREGPV